VKCEEKKVGMVLGSWVCGGGGVGVKNWFCLVFLKRTQGLCFPP